MAQSATERQKRYEEAQREKGMTKVRRWIPADQVERLDRYIARLKKESGINE